MSPPTTGTIRTRGTGWEHGRTERNQVHPFNRYSKANDGQSRKDPNQNSEEHKQLVLAQRKDAVAPGPPGGPQISNGRTRTLGNWFGFGVGGQRRQAGQAHFELPARLRPISHSA